MAMAMAALIGRRKIAPPLASTMIMRRWETTRTVVVFTQQRFVSHCINGQHERRWAAAEKSNCFIPHPRRYGTSLSSCVKKLCRHSNYDLAVDEAIQHYHKHVQMEDEDGQRTMVYPVRGASVRISGVRMFHILLKTSGGQKYAAICVAPLPLGDAPMKLVFFKELDDNNNVSLPFRKVVGKISWPEPPWNNALIVAVASFALAQHKKEGKLINLSSLMVGENEIFRMNFEVECSGIPTCYNAIVLVPRNNPEKMELVKFGIGDGSGMYSQSMDCLGLKGIVPEIQMVCRYTYDVEFENEYHVEHEYESEDEDENDDTLMNA